MEVLLAALSAVFYGSADFMGGLASKRESPLVITWFSQGVGLVSITAVALVVSATSVGWSDLGWGAAGGCAGAIGLLLLYGALAEGPMAVVAPLTALCSAVVPVVVGIATGDRPSSAALVGIALALPAVALVARSVEDTPSGRVRASRSVVARSLVSGAAFGLFFVFFASAGSGAGMWPTVAARCASVSLLTVVVVVSTRRGVSVPWRVGRSAVPMIVAAGVFDVSANALYLIASRGGLLSLISVVSAMYPAATVALARVVLGERLQRPQMVGLALTAAAVACVAVG